jgi:ketoreductase RED2
MGSMNLDGKVALVTGSSSGIGEAVARALANEGATVMINSSSSVEAGEKVAASLPKAAYVQGDIGDTDACTALVQATLDRFGRLDVLVNNAGTTKVIAHDDLDAATDEIWQRIFDVNVMGAWHLTRAAVPALRDSGAGVVVNITSVAGLRPTGSSIPYAVSKAALNHLTLLLARVLGPQIRVNAVAPGLVDTPWTAWWGPLKDQIAAETPLRRYASPDDVAEAVLGLVGSGFVTGQVITVDGGHTLR